MEHGTNCVTSQTVLDGAPVTGVLWQEPLDATDSGFRCWSAADEELDDETYQKNRAIVCLHCMIDTHPEAGSLMDRARIEGFAEI